MRPSPRPSGTDASPSRNETPDDFPFSSELKRKTLHLVALAVPGAIALLGKPTVLYVLVPLTLVALGADALRARSDVFSRLIQRIFGPLMRPDEIPPIGDPIVVNGATWVVLSATLLTLVFPVHIAAPALAMFMLADAMAALIGRAWGRMPWGIKGRTVEGSAAFLVTGLVAMAFISAFPLWIGSISVVAGCIAEIPPHPLNDNVRVPFVAATTLALLEWAALDHAVPLFL